MPWPGGARSSAFSGAESFKRWGAGRQEICRGARRPCSPPPDSPTHRTRIWDSGMGGNGGQWGCVLVLVLVSRHLQKAVVCPLRSHSQCDPTYVPTHRFVEIVEMGGKWGEMGGNGEKGGGDSGHSTQDVGWWRDVVEGNGRNMGRKMGRNPRFHSAIFVLGRRSPPTVPFVEISSWHPLGLFATHRHSPPRRLVRMLEGEGVTSCALGRGTAAVLDTIIWRRASKWRSATPKGATTRPQSAQTIAAWRHRRPAFHVAAASHTLHGRRWLPTPPMVPTRAVAQHGGGGGGQ